MTLHRELVNLEPKLSELFSTWDPPAVSPGLDFGWKGCGGGVRWMGILGLGVGEFFGVPSIFCVCVFV